MFRAHGLPPPRKADAALKVWSCRALHAARPARAIAMPWRDRARVVMDARQRGLKYQAFD